MANVRDSDTSLWLHNKLGTSNDSWTSGSICTQLNAEVLKNIKDCFPDLQTQVKLKLLLSFFHIPRRNVEEWKNELEEIIEVAAVDSDLWVAMLAEVLKTFPSSGTLNTEIAEFDETRPIFSDMMGELRRALAKHTDLGLLPLECLYLNKNALVSVVGQQPNPVKHFTLKRKPKSVALRSELLAKAAEAQANQKKAQAPTVPIRSRGMPRKMTDTTPLKGLGLPVRWAARAGAGRGAAARARPGIKLLDIADQPATHAQIKKRRKLEMEEGSKKAAPPAGAAPASPPSDFGKGLSKPDDQPAPAANQPRPRATGRRRQAHRGGAADQAGAGGRGGRQAAAAGHAGAAQLLGRAAAGRQGGAAAEHQAGVSGCGAADHAAGSTASPTAHHPRSPPGTSCASSATGVAAASDAATAAATAAADATAAQGAVAHARANAGGAGHVPQRQPRHKAREGAHTGLHGWLQRQPVPQPGQHSDDQAVGKHRERSPVGRHVPDHALRDALPDELQQRPVDEAQEVPPHRWHDAAEDTPRLHGHIRQQPATRRLYRQPERELVATLVPWYLSSIFIVRRTSQG